MVSLACLAVIVGVVAVIGVALFETSATESLRWVLP
jgi:hypothetical protein